MWRFFCNTYKWELNYYYHSGVKRRLKKAGKAKNWRDKALICAVSLIIKSLDTQLFLWLCISVALHSVHFQWIKTTKNKTNTTIVPKFDTQKNCAHLLYWNIWMNGNKFFELHVNHVSLTCQNFGKVAFLDFLRRCLLFSLWSQSCEIVLAGVRCCFFSSPPLGGSLPNKCQPAQVWSVALACSAG